MSSRPQCVDTTVPAHVKEPSDAKPLVSMIFVNNSFVNNDFKYIVTNQTPLVQMDQ